MDLPGIVGSSVSGEPTDLAERTKRLVSQYIQKEDCLVMVVCEGCASSVRNSTAFDLVLGRGGNPPWMGKASKAIGVLTKCDACATPGQIEKLQSRVQGASRDTPELKYGYVVRQQPTRLQRATSRTTAPPGAATEGLLAAAAY